MSCDVSLAAAGSADGAAAPAGSGDAAPVPAGSADGAAAPAGSGDALGPPQRVRSDLRLVLPPRPALWRRILGRVGLDFLMLGAFSAVLVALMIVYGGRLHYTDGSVLWPSLVLFAIVGASLLGHVRELRSPDQAVRRAVLGRVRAAVRDWAPVILLVLVYENLRGLTGAIRPQPIDRALYALDVALFGVEPVLFAQRFANPWLTDYFAFAYALYFVLPLTLATVLYVRGFRQEFRDLMLGVVMVMYAGFLLFVLFPAGPPRFCPEIMPLFDPPRLSGRFGLFELTQGAWDKANPDPVHASFPSLHCALSAMALFSAWRHRKGVGGPVLFWVFLPLVASLWLSTIYLRHHWIVDCFAGIGLAAIVFAVTPWLHRAHAALLGETGR